MPRILILVTCLLLQGCTIGFRNSASRIPEEFSAIYVPSAKDSSIYAGNSARLSFAVRKQLSLNTRIHLTDLRNARVALQMKVLDRVQTIAAVDSCQNPSTPTVASGAFSCAVIHPELTGTATNGQPSSFSQPPVSPSTEQLSLVVEVKAIDLNTGAVIFAKRYTAAQISPIVFDEIGDSGDGRTKVYTEWTPDLHALRYQEAVDDAVRAFSEAIASDVSTLLAQSLATVGMGNR